MKKELTQNQINVILTMITLTEQYWTSFLELCNEYEMELSDSELEMIINELQQL